MRDVAVGISGWKYAPWRGVFYPPGLPQRSELEFASRQMRTIELNGSFYSLQRPESYATWRDAVPEGFTFAIKGGRFITHNKKLRDCFAPLANFFASGLLALGKKLGPVLWQLPPQLGFDEGRLAAFFDLLPRTTKRAAKLARAHDERLEGRSFFAVKEDRPIRYALEVRHPSFETRAFHRLLETHDIALCIADTAGKWPAFDALTTDLAYVRLHGSKRLYTSGYTKEELDRWATRIEVWRQLADVYVYFDNDVKARAPFDAMNLAARLGHGERVTFPRKRFRTAELRRGAEEPRTSWPDFRKRSA